jgi:hypothetical protein
LTLQVPRARAIHAIVDKFGEPGSIKQKPSKSKVRKQRSHSSSMFH